MEQDFHLGYFEDDDLEQEIEKVMSMPDSWQNKYIQDFLPYN